MAGFFKDDDGFSPAFLRGFGPRPEVEGSPEKEPVIDEVPAAEEPQRTLYVPMERTVLTDAIDEDGNTVPPDSSIVEVTVTLKGE